tara:strand:- start:2062 stop:2325 length:264 start_codon:yes stop_codon:yes gene_type:complete
MFYTNFKFFLIVNLMSFLPPIVACCTASIFAIDAGFNTSVNAKLGTTCLDKLGNPEDKYQLHYQTWGKAAIAFCCLVIAMFLFYTMR